MNIALGQWIATLANQRSQQTGQKPEQELTWALEWVDTYQGAYRALGAPYGDDDDGLLRWLTERAPRLLAGQIGPSAEPPQEQTQPEQPLQDLESTSAKPI